MTSGKIARRALAMAALTATAVLASCAEPPPPPAPPPPPPAISLSDKVIEQASAYRGYVERAGAISPAFTSGPDVAQSLRTGESYEPQQLLRGAIAYGAVAALQDPGFVAAVRAYAADPTQRRTIAYSIMKDPAYVVGISGSAGAAGLVESALGGDGLKLLETGKAVKQAAYDVQHSSWSKAEVVGREGRLMAAKQLSSTPISGAVDETARLQQAVGGDASATLGLQAGPASPPYTPLVVRSLAVAALAALGYADDASLEQVMPLMADPNAANCLKMSKLNLYQCLAVARPHYEDVFCLGQHALKDTGACLMTSAGVAQPTDVASQPVKVADTAPGTSSAPSRNTARR